MKYNELKSGTVITVEGRKDNPNGWWGARIDPFTEGQKYQDLHHKVLEKIVKEGNYEIINGNLCITHIRIK